MQPNSPVQMVQRERSRIRFFLWGGPEWLRTRQRLAGCMAVQHVGIKVDPPRPTHSLRVEIDRDLSEEGRERLTAFSKSTDGFALAELDFSMRGPGDLFGTQQHGLPPLRLADLQRDRDILEEARREAQLLVSEDPGLKHAEHERLREQMLKRYGEALDISDVG